MPETRTASANPFRMARIEALPFRGPAAPDLWRTARERRRSLLVGGKGRGKTTLMEVLAEEARQGGWTVVWAEARPEEGAWERFLTAWSLRGPAGAALFIEAIELLPARPLWSWRLRVFDVVVATSHHPLPGWGVLHSHHSDLLLLDGLLDELLGAEADDWREIAHQLFGKHDGNVREVWRSLYDRWSDGTSVESQVNRG